MTLTATSIAPIGDGHLSMIGNRYRDGDFCGGSGWTTNRPLINTTGEDSLRQEIENQKKIIDSLLHELANVKAQLEEERLRVSDGELAKSRQALEDIAR